MTNIETTQQYLDSVRPGRNTELVTTVQKYLQDGDISVVELLPAALSDWRSRGLADLAATELFETDAAEAVLKVAVHRISISNVAVVDSFTATVAFNCVAADKKAGLDIKLIEMLREKGVTDYDLAKFWLTNVGVTGSFERKFHRPDVIFFWRTGPITEDHVFDPASLFRMPDDLKPENVFEEIIYALSDDDMLRLLHRFSRDARAGTLQALLARDKPHLIQKYIDELASREPERLGYSVAWPYVTANTEQFDELCLEHCRNNEVCYPIVVLDGLRNGKHKELVIQLTKSIQQSQLESGGRALFIFSFLAKNKPELLFEKLVQFAGHHNSIALNEEHWGKYYSLALQQWDSGGEKACLAMPVSLAYYIFNSVAGTECNATHRDTWIRDLWERCGTDRLREQIVKYSPEVVEEQLWITLQDKRKTERAYAVRGLSSHGINNTVHKAEQLLTGKVDARLGAAELLIALGNDEAVALLKKTLEQKQSVKVTKAVIAGLESLGQGASLDDPGDEGSSANTLATIETAKIKPLSKSTKEWIDLKALPELRAKSGDAMTEKAICYLIAAQSKHKTINPAPDAIPVLQQVDREKSGEFAQVLLQQWLASSCNAADKWVLTLSGLMGDRSILSALSDPIAGWAQASRHKLAEYAAQAIALVPADESLMLLDLLANRYRSKFKNIGKACKTALEQAAAAQNISLDELADMIVPTLEFNTEYQRSLPDTDIQLVLQPDFKLSYLNPETDKETRSVPKTLPDSAKAEIKTLRTLIRQTIKGQTARLELDLVRQRSWQTQRWQELFEVNPFLQSYASRLVWATLDKDGKQRKLFRRYPNGLLADASGDLIELDDSDNKVVMVHPLNLDEGGIVEWRAHLERMKVTPPFAQLERPVERLDAKHANRKQIAFTDGHRMANGTFRSRAEKRGWTRGSVVDGGGITSYYKTYPGALISVFLMVDEHYIGQDPADSLLLRHGLFVKAESIVIGSYIYDEPKNTDDERVIAFGDVPQVVYSESISDLQAIVASK